VGLHFTAPPAPGGLQWQGRGPHECYWDRKWGAPLRRHRVDTVEELHVPYIVPGTLHTPCHMTAPTQAFSLQNVTCAECTPVIEVLPEWCTCAMPHVHRSD
jgi:Beta galactosidase small chain